MSEQNKSDVIGTLQKENNNLKQKLDELAGDSVLEIKQNAKIFSLFAGNNIASSGMVFNVFPIIIFIMFVF